MAIRVQILTISNSPVALRVKSVGGWEVRVNRVMDSVMEKVKEDSNDTLMGNPKSNPGPALVPKHAWTCL